MENKLKLGDKHKKIIKTIKEKGMYKPTYSDHEPATRTLIKAGIIDWRPDFKGLVLTELGKTI